MNKKTLCLFMSFIMTMLLCISSFASGFSWYFKPKSDGGRPELCPEADFVNKYNTVTIGNEGEKKIYLTFDAGYENGNVEKILDIMKANDVKGTFFVLPRLVENNTDLCKRMKEEGHLVGNHSVHHKNMGLVGDLETFKKETVPLDEFFIEKTGYEMDKYFRPPEGAFSENTLKFADELGYTTVFWSLAYADWDNNKQMTPEKALRLLLSRTHDGTVLLLHPTSETNTNILDSYIKTLKGQGYEFCLVSELVKSTHG
ncbi:MAG: polysaccharide deacetylase family protein [Clostridia bacterium]|nr:polysaccharide deacetylase family protein [Clostridia bacterium]